MSIVDPMPLVNWDLIVQPADKLLTAADLETFPTDLPSGPVDYELDNGRLVFIMAPPGNLHGGSQSNLATHLKIQGEFKGYGKVRTETGVVLWRNPDRVVGPDVMFFANKSLPLRESPEGYLETIPELVVEIRSKNDSPAYIRRKVEHYLRAGVENVWLVDPAAKTVTIHAPNGEPTTHGIGDTLELGDLIPGFSLPVADVFRD